MYVDYRKKLKFVYYNRAAKQYYWGKSEQISPNFLRFAKSDERILLNVIFI